MNRTKVDVISGGSFARNAAAYQGGPSGLTSYAANERRTRDFLTATASQGTLRVDDPKDGGGEVELEVWCSNASYVFGFDRTNSRVYKSADGLTDWTLCLDSDTVVHYVLFASRAGLIFRKDTDHKVWYSSDNCATWTACDDVDNPGTQVTLGTTAQWYPWSFHEAANGTIVISTYGSVTGPGELWRSTDGGLSFKKVLSLDTGLITHFHSVCKHEATGLWVANTGDGGANNTCTAVAETNVISATGVSLSSGMRCYFTTTNTLPAPLVVNTTYWIERITDNTFYLHTSYADSISGDNKIDITDTGTGTHSVWSTRVHTFVSSDDGATWDYFSKVGSTGICSPTGQVTRFVDFGHATRLLIASDGDHMLGWVDVSTWEVGSYLRAWDPAVGNRYSFVSWISNGMVYATQYASRYTTGQNQPAISVAKLTDLTQWAHYDTIQTPAGTSQIIGPTCYAGYRGGVHHLCVQREDGTWNHYTIAPAKLTEVTGLLVHPATTNLLDAATSGCTSTAGFNSLSGWDTYNVTGNTLNLTKTTRIDHLSVYVNAATAQNKQYVASCWIKGTNCRKARIFFADKNAATTQSAEQARWFGVDPDDWVRIYSRPYTPVSVSGDYASRIYIAAYGNQYLNPMLDIKIDNILVQEVPATEYHPGPSASTAETWSGPLTTGSAWTQTFDLQLWPSYSAMSSDTSPARYLCTWKRDALNYVSLYYDPSDYKFKLVSVDSGMTGTPVQTDAVWFGQEQAVKVVASYSQGALSVTILVGGIVHKFDPLTRAYGSDLEGTFSWLAGNYLGASVYPLALADGYLYDCAFDEDSTDTFLETGLTSEWASDVTTEGEAGRHWMGVYAAATGSEESSHINLANITADWLIVVDTVPVGDPSTPDEYAAAELQTLLNSCLGVTVPLDDNPFYDTNLIYVGASDKLALSSLAIDTTAMGDEEFRIRTGTNVVAIAGGQPRGTLYGVYEFLERYCGLRFVTSAYTYAPSPGAGQWFGPIDYHYDPPIVYRESYFAENSGDQGGSLAFGVRKRQNSMDDLHTRSPWEADAKYGDHSTWQRVNHNMSSLLPPATYFGDHPTYFALHDAARQSETPTAMQACNTIEAAQVIVKDAVAALIVANPTDSNFNICQMDNHNFCTETNCAALDAVDGSSEIDHAAAHLTLVNYVADALASANPTKVFSTLAYQYTLACPSAQTPSSNVMVSFAIAGYLNDSPWYVGCVAHALDDPSCARNVVVNTELTSWSGKTRHLGAWLYPTNYVNELLPSTSINAIGPSIKRLVDAGATHMTVIGTWDHLNEPFADLLNYLICGLEWDPTRDPDSLIAEFCSTAYGAAGSLIVDWINWFDQYLTVVKDCHPSIGETGAYASYHPVDSTMAAVAKAFFDDAEALVTGDTLDRVKKAGCCAYRALIEAVCWPINNDLYAGADFETLKGYCETLITRMNDYSVEAYNNGIDRAAFITWMNNKFDEEWE